MQTFEEISDFEEMQLYLRDTIKDGYFYHYTSILNIVNIIHSKSLWLNSADNMNDLYEKYLIEHYKLNGILYYTSLSKADESLALYEKYCKDNKAGALLKIPCSCMSDIIEQNTTPELNAGIFADGKYLHSVGHFKVVDFPNKKITDKKIQGSIFCGKIAYFDPRKRVITCGTRENSNFRNPFEVEEMIGWVKYKCWNYEDEVRLFVQVEEQLNNNERIAVQLSDSVMDLCEVITGPYFDRKANEESINKLRLYGVTIKESIYEGCAKFD